MPLNQKELLELCRKIRTHRDRFDLLIVEGDTTKEEFKKCEADIDQATLKMVEYLRKNDSK